MANEATYQDLLNTQFLSSYIKKFSSDGKYLFYDLFTKNRPKFAKANIVQYRATEINRDENGIHSSTDGSAAKRDLLRRVDKTGKAARIALQKTMPQSFLLMANNLTVPADSDIISEIDTELQDLNETIMRGMDSACATVLTTGKFTVSDNGISQDYDFGIPLTSIYTVTGAKWDDPVAATPEADIAAAKKIVRDASANQVTDAYLNEYTMAKLQATLHSQSSIENTPVKNQIVEDGYFSRWQGINWHVIGSSKVVSTATSEHIPNGKVIFVADSNNVTEFYEGEEVTKTSPYSTDIVMTRGIWTYSELDMNGKLTLNYYAGVNYFPALGKPENIAIVTVL